MYVFIRRDFLADYCGSSFPDCPFDIGMAIDRDTAYGHKQKAFFHFAGIRLDTCDLDTCVSDDLKYFQRTNEFF